MGTVSRLPEKVRMTAPIIASEGEAFDSAHDLVRRLQSLPESSTLNDRTVVTMISESGLTGISLPPEAGGADVSNAVLGEVILSVATASRLAGSLLSSHLYCVELLRELPLAGPAAYFHARALAGDIFHLADAQENASTLAPELGKPGWRLNGRVDASEDLIHADWIVLINPAPAGGEHIVFLPRMTPGLRLWDNHASFHNVHVDGDCVFEIDDLHAVTAEPVGQLLKSAERLGWAEKKLNEALSSHVRAVPQRQFGQDYLSLLGLTVSRLENGKAALERAGGKIDNAQVNPGEAAAKNATFSAAIALSSAAEALDLATELFHLHPEARREMNPTAHASGSVGMDIDPYGHAPIGATILDVSLH